MSLLHYSTAPYASIYIPTPVVRSESNAPREIKRRSRNGCFTCRERRVKCDELRPRCNRCRPGNRQCIYPKETDLDSPLPSQSTPNSFTSQSDDEDGPYSRKNSNATSFSSNPDSRRSQTTATTNTRHNSSSKSGAASAGNAQRREFDATSLGRMPLNLQHHLRFHLNHLTHWHYFLRADSADFIHTDLIEAALDFEPLLYALIAFSVHHSSVPHTSVSIENFDFCTEAVTRLREWLAASDVYSKPVLLTILQLATLECYGERGRVLASHVSAARQIFVFIYTPESLAATPRGQVISQWMCQLEIMLAYSNQTCPQLPRHWFVSMNRYWNEAAIRRKSVDHQLACLTSFSQVSSWDVATVSAEVAQLLASAHQPSQADPLVVMTKFVEIAQALADFRRELECLSQSAVIVVEDTHLAFNRALPRLEVRVWHRHLWVVNILWLEWYGLVQTLCAQYQAVLDQLGWPSILSSSPTAQAVLDSGPQTLVSYSEAQCHICAAIQRVPDVPAGFEFVSTSCLALMLKFGPGLSSTHLHWLQQKLTHMEESGHTIFALQTTRIGEH